jgi:hypothetical protein
VSGNELSMVTAYVSIGNSDDKLSQHEWSHFWAHVNNIVREFAAVVHGTWLSRAEDPWQNACWCVEVPAGEKVRLLREVLREAAREYRQDSIAWAQVPATEFLAPR